MKKELQDILKDHEVNPPKHVWERIDASLNRKKQRFVMPLWKQISGIAAAILMLLGFYHILHQERSEKKPEIEFVAQKEQKQSQKIKENKQEHNIETGVNLTQETRQLKNAEKTKKHKLTRLELFRKEKMVNLLPLKNNEINVLAHKTSVLNHKIEMKAKHVADEFYMEVNSVYVPPKKRIQFSPSIGTQYVAFNTLQELANKNQNLQDNTNYDLSAGINFTLKTNKRIAIQTGILYAQMSQKTAHNSEMLFALKSDYMAERLPETSWGNIRINSSESDFASDNASVNVKSGNTSSQITQLAGYLEIPFILRYTLIDRKIDVEFLGGIHAGYLIQNTATIKQGSSTKKGETSGLKNFTSNSVAGISFTYDINNKLNINIGPKLKYHHSNLSKTTNTDFKPMVFGVFTGINYNF